jgi:hypothetical protein
VTRLRRTIPGLPRNTTAAYVRRLRRVRRRRQRRRWSTLHWLVPGAVWAIDGTWFGQAIADHSRRALVVVELHGRQLIDLRAVPGERACVVVACLRWLIEWHGAPLVLKADNGSAFISDVLRDFCERHAITLLFSPPRCPRFNGACEVSGRWAKHRAQAAAARRGSDGQLCQADLDSAVTCTGPLPRVCEELRARLRATIAEQLAAVAAERGLVIGKRTPDHVRRSLERVAIQRALQLCHILKIEGRAFPRCLPAPAA